MALYERHFALLKSWNERMSLVSSRSLETAFATHYVDSLYIADLAHQHTTKEPFYDLGAGAGFPGMIFAIRFPKCEITLFEKSLKKQTFLAAVIAQLGLTNVRLEGHLHTGSYRGLWMARAVYPRAELFQFFAKRLQPESRFIANLGGRAEDFSFPKAFSKETSIRYSLPQDCGDRVAELFRIVPRGTITR